MDPARQLNQVGRNWAHQMADKLDDVEDPELPLVDLGVEVVGQEIFGEPPMTLWARPM